MNSSRHEKAALVTTAYVIGAVTAFIWFGLTNSDIEVMNLNQPPLSSQVASLALAVPPASDLSLVATVPSLIQYQNGLLEVVLNDESKILSYNPITTGYGVAEDFVNQGIHYSDIIYSASDSGEYIFFCEAKSVDADFCSAFIYDTLTDVIYPITRSQMATQLTLSMARSAIWTGSLIDFGSFRSVSALTPWVMNY